MSLPAALRNRFTAPPESTATDDNIRNFYLEIVFASILGGIITFNSVFAIRLGASETLIAWLGSGPALIAALVSIPASRYLATRRKRKLWLFGSLFFQRAGYVVVALMPLFIHANIATWLVLWIIFLNIPAIFFTNGFQVLQGELIPEHRRAFVMSRRSIIYSVGVVLISALAGVWLDHVEFPLNYQLMYVFGFVIVLGSQFFLNRLTVPDLPPRPPQTPVQPKKKVQMSPAMLRMLINTGIYQFGLSLPAQLFNIYYVRTLHTTDGWLGLNSSAANLGVIIGYILWERLIRRRSFFWGQRRATLLTWIFPFVLALVTDLNIIVFANFVVNIMHPGVDLSNFNVLLKLSDPEDRPAYVSWFNMVINLATFAGPIVGAWVAERWGIILVLFFSAALRIVGGLLYNFNRVEAAVVQPETVVQ